MKHVLAIAALLVLALAPFPAVAQDRYVQPPPVLVSPDLSAPWVMQLRRAPAGVRSRHEALRKRAPGTVVRLAPDPVRARARPSRPASAPDAHRARHEEVRTAAVSAAAARGAAGHALDPKFLPQTVEYDGPYGAGTIVVDTKRRFLFHVLGNGKARRYGVGVGKEGFAWSGTHRITAKRKWPDWRPPAAMIAREKKKGRILPAHMKGGPANPLGARALYIGSTLYRIHGTNAPWTIGKAVSSGCIRMRNEDVIELYDRVDIGTKVVVI
jgi:lipoprotein-anchoring transpeptidase ErfK/SrfK